MAEVQGFLGCQIRPERCTRLRLPASTEEHSTSEYALSVRFPPSRIGALLALAFACGSAPEDDAESASATSTGALTAPLSPLSIPYVQISTWAPQSPTQAGATLLQLAAGNLVVKSSRAWGGAIHDFSGVGTGSLVNRHDAGRLWQSMVNVYEKDNLHFVNPTEAGDGFNRGSAVLQFQNRATAPFNVQLTKSAPFGFLNVPKGDEDYLGGTSPAQGNVAVQFNGMTIGKELTLGFDGDPNVARYVTKVFTSAPIARISGNLPVLYLPGHFRALSTYNAVNGAWRSQVVSPGQSNVPSQDDASCGGVVAENDTRTVGVALYACKPGFHGGAIRHLAFSNASYAGNADPLADDTMALMASTWWGDGVGLPLGESQFTTYVVVCTAPSIAGARCVESMARLYRNGR